VDLGLNIEDVQFGKGYIHPKLMMLQWYDGKTNSRWRIGYSLVEKKVIPQIHP